MEKNNKQKYNISKGTLEDIIFDELFTQEEFDANEFHKTIVKLLAEELYESVTLENDLETLKEKGIFQNLKIEDTDLQVIAIDNIIIQTIENCMKEIDKDYHLMPLTYNVKYHHVKEKHICNIIQKLKPQIKNTINPEVKEEARLIAEEAFQDGIIFDNVIEDIDRLLEKEIHKRYINMFKNGKVVLEEYRKEKSLKILIEDVSEQLKEHQTSYVLEEIEEDDALYDHIDNTSKNIQLSAKEIEESITYGDNYKRIRTIVPTDELCGLISINSAFSKNKTK